MPKKSSAKMTFLNGQLSRASPGKGVHVDESDDVDDLVKIELFVGRLVANLLADSENIRLIVEYLGLPSNTSFLARGQGGVQSCKGTQARSVAYCEIIRPRDLPVVTGLSRTQCWRLSRDPTSGFPPKIRLSSGAVGYSRELLEKWLKTREEI